MHMYLRETRQKRADGSLVTHLQLAESVWNPHKKRSEVRILHNCGRAEDLKTAERLRTSRAVSSKNVILKRLCSTPTSGAWSMPGPMAHSTSWKRCGRDWASPTSSQTN